MSLENKINKAESLLSEIFILSSPQEWKVLLDRLLINIRTDLKNPSGVKFTPSKQQRSKHIKNLTGMEFSKSRHGHKASYTITKDGRFKTPTLGTFNTPSAALMKQWFDMRDNQKKNIPGHATGNGWEAKDKNGKDINAWIREFVLKEAK